MSAGGMWSTFTVTNLKDFPPVLNSAQVAEILSLPSNRTVQHLVRTGRLPAYRIPGVRRYWFFRDEITAWLESDEPSVSLD